MEKVLGGVKALEEEFTGLRCVFRETKRQVEMEKKAEIKKGQKFQTVKESYSSKALTILIWSSLSGTSMVAYPIFRYLSTSNQVYVVCQLPKQRKKISQKQESKTN